MEEALLRWQDDTSFRTFPWNWEGRIRPIELEVFRRLKAGGLVAPPQLFCPAHNSPESPRCTCTDASKDMHKLLASRRAEATINTWGQHLFPLVTQAEVNIRGIRPMPVNTNPRAEFYEVSGIVDVLGSVEIGKAPSGNLLLHQIDHHQDVAKRLADFSGQDYEIIVDYKGMRRPSASSPEWQQYEWQLQTYAWLRSLQPDAKPVIAGTVIFVNELVPSQEDIVELKSEVTARTTDVMPNTAEVAALMKWRRRQPIPTLSTSLREQRSVRIIPIDDARLNGSLDEFDRVVKDIEDSVLLEMGGSPITTLWARRPSGGSFSAPERRTCTACDHKHYCPVSQAVGYGKPPQAP